MKFIYIDTINSGISGDMLLAALLKFVSEPHSVLNELMCLKDFLPGVSNLNINLGKEKRFGILINKLDVSISEKKHHRSSTLLKTALRKFLDEKNYSDLAKAFANEVLDRLIKAEAEVHEDLEENIHLHELSSVDTLVDILGVSKCLDLIGGFKQDFKFYCSKLPLGGGTINAAHGILPIPAPATLSILKNSNLEVFNGPIDSELVTPTGAALLVSLKPILNDFSFRIEDISYSSGNKRFESFLNVLRLYLGEFDNKGVTKEAKSLYRYIESIAVIETDVDDVSGEILGDFITGLKEKDILDIQIIPSITKKNRPSHLIKVLCHPEKLFYVIEKLLQELGTLGVRFNIIKRVCVDRKNEIKNLIIDGNKFVLSYKISYIDSQDGMEIINIKPEYEDLKKISIETGYSINKITLLANSEINEIYEQFKLKK